MINRFGDVIAIQGDHSCLTRYRINGGILGQPWGSIRNNELAIPVVGFLFLVPSNLFGIRVRVMNVIPHTTGGKASTENRLIPHRLNHLTTEISSQRGRHDPLYRIQGHDIPFSGGKLVSRVQGFLLPNVPVLVFVNCTTKP